MGSIPAEHVPPAIPHRLLYKTVVAPSAVLKLKCVQGSPDVTVPRVRGIGLADTLVYLELILAYPPSEDV